MSQPKRRCRLKKKPQESHSLAALKADQSDYQAAMQPQPGYFTMRYDFGDDEISEPAFY